METSPGTERRVLATILYLTDIEDGGATQFAYQNASVQPAAGALVIFPPFWTHLHRGETPRAGIKYKRHQFPVSEEVIARPGRRRRQPPRFSSLAETRLGRRQHRARAGRPAAPV